jgi:hypothetical protein
VLTWIVEDIRINYQHSSGRFKMRKNISGTYREMAEQIVKNKGDKLSPWVRHNLTRVIDSNKTRKTVSSRTLNRIDKMLKDY